MDNIKSELQEQLKEVKKVYDFIETIEEWQNEIRNSLRFLGIFIETEINKESIKNEKIEGVINEMKSNIWQSSENGYPITLGNRSIEIIIVALEEYKLKGENKQ